MGLASKLWKSIKNFILEVPKESFYIIEGEDYMLDVQVSCKSRWHMLCSQKINKGQVISKTGPKLLNRLALKSQNETKLYSLRVYQNSSKAIASIRSGRNSTALCSDVLIVLMAHICGLMVAWYSVLVCMLLYLFKRSQLGSEVASWISCQYTKVLLSYHSRAPLTY
jgi:hypothetical protein